MKIRGILVSISVKKTLSNDLSQRLLFEVHGNIAEFHELLDCPLEIEVRPE